MPRLCSPCRRSGKSCKVHVRSGRCGECYLSGATCNIRVTKSKWDRLKLERERLLKEIESARKAQTDARQAQLRADRELDVAFKTEMKLRHEMTSIEAEAEEVIAIEEANLDSLEQQTKIIDFSPLEFSGLVLSSYTWSAGDGLADQFWAPSPSLSWVLSSESNGQFRTSGDAR